MYMPFRTACWECQPSRNIDMMTSTVGLFSLLLETFTAVIHLIQSQVSFIATKDIWNMLFFQVLFRDVQMTVSPAVSPVLTETWFGMSEFYFSLQCVSGVTQNYLFHPLTGCCDLWPLTSPHCLDCPPDLRCDPLILMFSILWNSLS